MRRWVLLALLFAAPYLAPAPAQAQDTRLDSDLSCFVVTLSMMQSSEPQIRTAGQSAFQYWLGRLDGGDPNFDLEGRLPAAIAAMTPERIASESTRCGQEMIARGNEVQAIGRRMEARGQ